MEQSMKKLMHNLELLIVTTGKGNWKSALDAVSTARLLLGEIEREIQSRVASEAQERKRKESRRVNLP